MLMPRLFEIRRDQPGRLSKMAAPNGGDQLGDELSALAWLGVHTIISLLSEQERWELDLLDEGSLAASVGIEYLSLPTEDRCVPDRASVKRLAVELAESLACERHVVIHCRAGIGRSSLLAAAILRVEGLAAKDAWNAITLARGLDAPDTIEQREFIERFNPPLND